MVTISLDAFAHDSDKKTYNQIIGNRIRLKENVDDGYYCVGATPVKDIVPGLTSDMGVVPIWLTLSTDPFDDMTGMLYVCGSKRYRRLSSMKPYFSRKRCKDGTRKLFSNGDAWLDTSCTHEYFEEVNEDIFPVYVKGTIIKIDAHYYV